MNIQKLTLGLYQTNTYLLANDTEAVVIDLSQISDVNLTVLSAFAGRGDATLEGTTLTIGAQTSVVLK